MAVATCQLLLRLPKSGDEDAEEFESEEMVDDGTGVDREPGEKCRKCQRSGWQSRHASFCSDCQSQEMEKLRKKCEKCSRKGFAFRNIDFCETKCDEEKLKQEETTTAATEEPTKETTTEKMTTATTEQETTTVTEMSTMTTTVEEDGAGEQKKTRGGSLQQREQNRCKRCQRRGYYKRNTAFCEDTCHTSQEDDESFEQAWPSILKDDESGRKEPERARNDDKKKNKKQKKEKKNGKEPKEKLRNKLGPLEDLIKYLIQKNHGI